MFIEIILLFVGIGLLYLGGEALIKGSSALAVKAGLSSLTIGLTVVAFGTSAPELAVSLSSALQGRADIALGNVVGSNICNLGLILAATAMIGSLKIPKKILRTDYLVLLGTTGITLLFLADGVLRFGEGLTMVVLLAAFCVFTLKSSRRESALAGESSLVESSPEEVLAVGSSTVVKDLGLTLVGLGSLVAGGHLFVEGAVSLARIMSVSEAIIGLTVVALGTSLPELATSLLAAAKGKTDLALGNIIGSNIFNLAGVLGSSALVSSLPMAGITWFDLSALIVFTLAALIFCRTGWLLSRLEGTLLLAGYFAYVAFRYAS